MQMLEGSIIIAQRGRALHLSQPCVLHSFPDLGQGGCGADRLHVPQLYAFFGQACQEDLVYDVGIVNVARIDGHNALLGHLTDELQILLFICRFVPDDGGHNVQSLQEMDVKALSGLLTGRKGAQGITVPGAVYCASCALYDGLVGACAILAQHANSAQAFRSALAL